MLFLIFEPEGLSKIWRDVFSYFKQLSPIKIKDKSPYFMGTRMGRPEKSERKSMKGIHSLFPLSEKVGSSRSFDKAIELGKIKIEVCRKKCPKCGSITIFNTCSKCGFHTKVKNICTNCKKLYPIHQERCPQCGGFLASSSEAVLNFSKHVNLALKKLGLPLPKKVKGVYGLTNKYKVPEPLEKGLLRAKNEVLVYKTAEIRYDATDIPLTHFKPREIGITVNKLKDLGYKTDINNNPLNESNQILELKVQDILLSTDSAEYFIKVANFIDDELESFYGMPRFYNVKKREDLIGHLVVGLAPHTR
jgi:DNA polymerase II large subunit